MDEMMNIESPAEDAGDVGPESEFEQEMDPKRNLVPEYLQDEEKAAWLKKTVGDLLTAVKEDQDSLTDWIDIRDKHINLFCGTVPTMPYPAEGAPGSADPIMIKTILQLVSRGWDQICPAKGPIINVIANGQEDEEAAQRRNDHMNWSMREKIPNYVLGHLESYMQFCMSGSVFRAKWYDPTINCTRFDHLTADDVIISYARKDIDPLMRDVPRKTRIRRYQRHQLEALGRAGYYHDVKRLFAEGVSQQAPQEDQNTLEEGREKTEGIAQPLTMSAKVTTPRILHEVHCWQLLPGEEEMKAVVITYDKWTREPLAMHLRYKDDPIDKARFDLEMQAFQISTTNLTNEYAQAMQQYQMNPMGTPPPAPQMPEPPAPTRQVVEETMIHYKLFTNPQGFYGIGVGKLLEHPTEFINALSNEFLLSAKFHNLTTFIGPKGAMGKRGEIKIKMGCVNETELDAGEMAGMKAIQFNPPSEGLWKLIEKTRADASNLIAAMDTMSGEAGPTNETRGAATQRHAEAQELVSNIVRMYCEPMKEEAKMIAEDYSLYGPEMEMYWVTDPLKQRREKKMVKREDYANPFDFTFTADTRQGTRAQRVNAANNTIDRLNQGPYAKAPQGQMLFYEAYRELYTAMGNDRMVAALGPPPKPPAPPPPPQPMSQIDENRGFFEDKDHPVLPGDPHADHIRDLEILMASPYYQHMSATGKQMAERHLAAHYGALYQQQAGGMQNGQQQMAGPGGVPGIPGPPSATPVQSAGHEAPNGGGGENPRQGPGAGPRGPVSPGGPAPSA